MSKIARVTQKIFGSTAGGSQRAVFGSLAAGAPAFTTSPSTIQSLSNYLDGWFAAVIGGNSPAIEDMNSLQFLNSYQLAYGFQAGVAEWDTSTTYYIGSFVNVAGVLYVSLVDDNTSNLVTDTSKWIPYSSDVTGVGKDYWGTSLPAGYVWANGLTVGNAASNATGRANADTQALFTMLWGYNTSIFKLYNSAGSEVSRGVSASADFVGNCSIMVPDKRGRVTAALDNLGGAAAAGQLTTQVAGNGQLMGGSGGTQLYALSVQENATHTHVQDAHTHTQNPHHHDIGPMANAATDNSTLIAAGSAAAGSHTGTTNNQTAGNNDTIAVNQSSGNSVPHQNVQPTIVCAYIIKL